MRTQHITSFVNEYGQVDAYSILDKVEDLIAYRFYHKADALLNELYEIANGTTFDNVNNELFVLTFDEEADLYRLIDKVSRKLLERRKPATRAIDFANNATFSELYN